MHNTGHRFLCRVGSNCNFLKKLGRIRERQGIVYCWPKQKQDRKLPPLVMRLLRFLVPEHGQSFCRRMSEALTDTYVRTSQKKSRNFPRRKEEPQTGPPNVTLATLEQKKLDKLVRATQNSS